ncbi:MAG: glycosyltransferase [Oscillospiraceae bacterium]|nr:glycosyltransferase [Oscillospiraceae bacterium]
MKNKCIVITNPMIAANRSAEVTLSKFLRVISPCYQEVHVVGGNVSVEEDLKSVCLHRVDMTRSPSRWKRLLDHVSVQLKLNRMTKKLVEPEVPVYFWVADKMLLPYRTALRKKGDVRFFIYGNVLKEGTSGWFTKLSGKLIAYMANHAHSVCAESPGVLQEWQGLIAPRKFRVIHLYTEETAGTVNRTPGQTIGMLCRLTEGKRVLESIRGFTRFHAEHPGYNLEIIGSGRQEQQCRELIAQCNAQSFIHMAGWVEHSEVTRRAAHWQYLLFPSDTEGMPNSVIEMMGQGIPVIASPVGGVRDLVRDGENGWVLPGTTEEDIYRTLCKAVAAENYEIMAHAALAAVSEEFTLPGARENARIYI